MFVVQDLYWQEFCNLRASNTARVCKVDRNHAAGCDAINLGCLYQQLPNLQDPRQSMGACQKTVKSMVEASAKITVLTYKLGDHSRCAVGPRVVAEERILLNAVQGLELRDITC